MKFSHDSISGTDTGGDDQALVFVHGYTCDHTDWVNQTELSDDGLRVIAVDLPGHGESADGDPSIMNFGAAVAGIVDTIDRDDTVLVGHSMGCRVVLEAATHCESHLSGLVLVDGSRAAESAHALEELNEAVEEIGFHGFAEMLFRQMFTDKTPEDVVESTVARALAFDPDWALSLWTNMATWDVEHVESVLDDLELPVAAIQTTYLNSDRQRVTLDDDADTPYTEFLRPRLRATQSQIVVMPDTGHFPQFEEPGRLNAMINEFVTSL